LNFLAHIYLSGDDEERLIGNFIADFVKGNKKNDFPEGIRKGIELHRGIDDYTDHHPLTIQSKRRLQPKYGKYAGVIIDLYYDHFLARNFSDYSDVPLAEFSENTYRILREASGVLPEGVNYFLPFMIERNWLVNYASIAGIGRALKGLSTRVSFPNKMDESVHELEEHYSLFLEEFRLFFPQLITFVQTVS